MKGRSMTQWRGPGVIMTKGRCLIHGQAFWNFDRRHGSLYIGAHFIILGRFVIVIIVVIDIVSL